jgi:hypothetical protein
MLWWQPCSAPCRRTVMYTATQIQITEYGTVGCVENTVEFTITNLLLRESAGQFAGGCALELSSVGSTGW